MKCGQITLRFAAMWLILLPSTMHLRAQFPASDPKAACSLKNLKGLAKDGGFDFRSFRNESAGTACFEVFTGNTIIFRRTNDNDGWYEIGQKTDKQYKVPAIANGTDITGRGHPDMIVSFYSGGAHCCLSHYVFELEPAFKLLATLDAEDGWPAYFANIDGKNHFYYMARDWAFAYWPSSFAGSPSAPIILQYVNDKKGGSYHLALDKMYKPEPTPKEWGKLLNETRDPGATLEERAETLELESSLWNSILNLIYSGHSNLAWKFYDEAWPSNIPGKNKWLGDFCSRLKSSLYWPDIEKTVQNAPPACLNAKP